MEPVRVLYFLNGAMRYGGTEAFIMNYYRHFDHNKIAIDFVIQGDDLGVYDDELESYGSIIYHVAIKKQHPLKYSVQTKKIIQEGNYKIVHSMMDAMGAWPLSIAKKVGVPVRIAHSHNTKHQTNFIIKKAWNDVAKKRLIRVANLFWACGEDAGRWLYGRKLYDAGKVTVIHNAIDVSNYSFNIENRNEIRRELNVSDNAIVIGHVGQFREQKNHSFLLKVFKEIKKQEKNAVLILVGDGKLKEKIQHEVEDFKLSDSVIFTGSRNDANKIFSAFDIFLFPSLYEGLSIVAIEAQCNGLPCVFSDTISNETIITDQVKMVGLSENKREWSNAVFNSIKNGRVDNMKQIEESGYDINVEAKKLQDVYIKLYDSNIPS